MKIEKNSVASVTYSLQVDGELIEKTEKENPLIFLVGAGSMIPGFERQLMGKEKGDTYDITIDPEEGYGESDPEAIVDLSKDVFKIDGVLQEDMLQKGKIIPMQDQNGQPLQGVVLDVDDETVKMDFNHRLAGKKLDFTGEIIDVRPATDDEISHGHVHGPGGHHH
jgi:FKBP-type peptidyl-prolyl cis-trans isomerase SlyD